MQTYGTPYHTPYTTENDPARHSALPTRRDRTGERQSVREAMSAGAGVPLELWDCEHGSLSSGETRLFRVRFPRGHAIRLRAWAKDGVGISVQDGEGHTLAQDSRQGSHPNCCILPQRSGEYLVTLANTVDHEAHYVLYIADETLMPA